MTQEEFKKILDRKGYSHYQDGKWLVIHEDNDDVYLNDNNLKSLPDYLWFKNFRNVELYNNALNELPPNLIFGNSWNVYLNDNELEEIPKSIIFKNKGSIFFENNNDLILYNYYHIRKIDFTDYEYIKNIIFNISNKYLHEYLCKINHIIGLIYNYQTPHICFTKVLENKNNKDDIKINLPKNFLSISSWI